MKNEKTQVAVIDFTKFDIQQLPELQGKKEEIKAIIKANPAIAVVDNASYELAKKSRTAVRTLRTSLEKEQKDVKKRIKEYVLDVVDAEYDNIILGVKNQEIIRQEPIDAWEEIKENERLEKLRLEQERVDNIKKSISEFRIDGERFINTCVFESIDATTAVFEKRVAEFDRASLAEFEVLFDDAVSYLTNLLNSRISTLTEQENIRIQQIELAKEKERQRLEAEKNEVERKRIAEEQRIAQENFLREKREFEEKQLQVKVKERTQRLLSIGLVRDDENEGFKIPKIDGHLFYDWQISGFDEYNFETSFDWYKEQMTAPKSNESAKESVVVFEIDGDNLTAHEEVKADGYSTSEEPIVFDILGKEEETWESILEEFNNSGRLRSAPAFIDWLNANYYVPTRKN